VFETQGDDPVDHAGIAVSVLPFGQAIAIGFSQLGPLRGVNYVKVFRKNLSDMSYSQIGDTIYGDSVGDGFGESLALSHMFTPEDGLILLVGSLNGGYAHLYATTFEGENWSQLDQNETFYQGNDASEVVVDIAGANGRRIFLASPQVSNGRGAVRTYALGLISKSSMNPSQLTAKITLEDNDNTLSSFQGIAEGDWFGSDISVDKTGTFAVIGAKYGGYARTLHRSMNAESWSIVGNDINATYCSSVSTGLISADDPCRLCPNTLNETRISIASLGQVATYQFDEESDDWVQLGDSIRSDDACSNIPDLPQFEKQPSVMLTNDVIVTMSPNSHEVAVSCPASNYDRGVVSVYKIAGNAVSESNNVFN
jgi:hypothetical protein